MIELLFLLLPIAAASGWWVARRAQPTSGRGGDGRAPASFFRGLNYLLDEQPDKAIDVFLQIAEVDDETAETHLALGSLFRRRGEVERAIRIHQNLVARPGLAPEQRGLALYELGQDYRRAGLLDRAEGLFRELLERRLEIHRALKALAEIYQQERDWVRALEIAEQLRQAGIAPMQIEMAQFHCELAEQALRIGTHQEALWHLDQAHARDPRCVRAAMLRADLAIGQGDTRSAIEHCRQVIRQDSRYVQDILPRLAKCLGDAGSPSWLAELTSLWRHQPSPALILALVEAIRQEQGDVEAIEMLVKHLARQADLAALARLLEIETARAPAELISALRAALGVVRFVLARQPAYQCEHCGFTARHLHWQCPSCKRWTTVCPVLPEPLTESGA